MQSTPPTNPTWQDTAKAFCKPAVIAMLFFGLSAGLPLLLIFSSLSLWLGEAGVERSTITYFSWAALAYSFKFLWAPLVDKLPLPLLTKQFGRRRGWLLFSQSAIIAAICAMATTDPSVSDRALLHMAIATVALGFASATQDVVIDAFRIESGDQALQALMSSTYIMGYRIGMLTSGAGALFLASYFGSTKEVYLFEAWRSAYFVMACVMLVGVFTTLQVKEPTPNTQRFQSYTTLQYIRFFVLFLLSVAAFVAVYAISADITKHAKSILAEIFHNTVLASLLIETLRLMAAVAGAFLSAFVLTRAGWVSTQLVSETYVQPVRDFFVRYGANTAILLLVFVCFYRVSDIVLGVIANVFYQDMGYSKNEIATVSKTFGLFMTIAGGFLGGVLALRTGLIKTLFTGGLLTVVTNLLFMVLANSEANLTMLYIVISADNLAGGLASAAFVAFLSSLTNISFTASQYAIFSSIMSLVPKVIGGYSGSMVDNMGYSNFFLLASLMGVPVLGLIFMVHAKLLKQGGSTNNATNIPPAH